MKTKLFSFVLSLLLSIWIVDGQNVTVAGSVSGNGSYATLGEAITAIPLAGQSGNNITVEIGASTTEVSTGITIGAGTWSSLKIFPTAIDIIVSAAASTSTSPFLILSGANNVTIDGRLNQTGASSLTIINTSTANTTSGSTISFDNNAQNNTIKYCTVKGNQQGDFGVISFSANATATNGNGLNVIDHNLITNNGTVPKFGIYAIGNTSFPNIGNQITNNEFKNLFAAGINSIALNVVGGLTAGGLPQNDNYTISGNSFYQTSWLTPSSDGARQFIGIGSGTNTFGGSHMIKDNYFGSTAANCSGTVMGKSNRTNALTCIYISTSPSTVGAGPSSIQNNTIQKINWQNGTNGNFNGILVAGTGDVNIGTETGNTIGDNTTTGSITLSNFASANSIGIQIANTGTVNCQKNKIGSINVYNGTVAIAAPFNGIQKTATAGTVTISNNIIGSLTTANSIYAYYKSVPEAAAVAQNVYPILFQGTGTGTISNNTIANVTNFTTIGNLFAIYLNGTGSTTTVNANLIHSNTITGYTGTGSLMGIQSLAGINTITNNIIKLGDNNACQVRGISDGTSTTAGAKIYHNTVYIGGTPTTDAFISACLHNTYNASQTAKDYRNNMLVNARSNAGSATGEHYAFYITSNTATGLTIDGNNYYTTGTGGYLLKIGTGTATNTLPSFTDQDAASKNVNPNFANAGGTTVADYIPSAMAGVTGTGVTKDFNDNTRIAQTIGAIEVAVPTILKPINNSNIDFIRTNSGQFELIGIVVSNGNVYSAQGKLIKSFNTNRLNINDLPKGVYLMSVSDKSGAVYHRKFAL